MTTLHSTGSNSHRSLTWSLGHYPVPRLVFCRLLWLTLTSFSLHLYLVLIRLFAIRLSEVLVGICCIYFTVIKFLNFDTDTTSLSNVFFALLGPLAMLAFAYANTLDREDGTRKAMEVAGARSFHGAVLLVLASVLKYALLHIKSLMWVPSNGTALTILDCTLGLMAGILFLLAAVEAFASLRTISDLFVMRLLDKPVLLKLHGGEEHKLAH